MSWDSCIVLFQYVNFGISKKLMLSTSYHACLQWHLCQRTGEKANTLLESNRCRRPKLIALLTLFQAAKACRLNHYTVTNCAWLYTYVRYIHLYTLFVYIYIHHQFVLLDLYLQIPIQKFKCVIHANSTCCHHESSCQIVAFGPVPANRMQVRCSRIHSWPLSINSTSSKKNKNENRQKWQQNTINSFGHLNFPT